MKHLSAIFNLSLTGILVLILLHSGLPGPGMQTAQAAVAPAQTSTDPCDADRSIHVSGTAMINVQPDRALIQLGVQSNGPTPAVVQKNNDAAIMRVVKAVRGLGVEAEDITTDRYIIRPVYEPYDSLMIKGYRIHNIVAITLRDVSQTSAVIAAALASGANQVVNVELYTSELRKYRDQARELAMKAASEKAQALANAVGTEAGSVLNISENSWSYYNGWWYGQEQDLWTQNTVQNAGPANPTSGDAEPVSLGQISVKAEVSVSFGLK